MSGSKAKNKTKIETNLIPLSEAAKKSGYTPEYLNSLSRKGILRAQKIGRNWHTTQEWLDEFIRLNSGKKNKNGGEEISVAGEPEEILSSEEKTPDVFSESPVLAHKTKSANPHSSSRQIIAGVFSMAIVIPIVFIFIYSIKIYSNQKKIEMAKIAVVRKNPVQVIVNENGYDDNGDASGIVKGETTSASDEAAKKAGIVLASESYKASSVSLGGEIILASEEENLPLEVTDVKSESFVVDSQDNSQGAAAPDVKLVVSWKTNKLAKSTIEYSKNNGQDPKSIDEQSYGFNHSIILASIDPATSYVFQVKARDHWGTEVASDYYGLFTTSKPASVFDLISKQVNDIFGWAIKK